MTEEDREIEEHKAWLEEKFGHWCRCDKPNVMIIDNSKIEHADGYVDEFYAEVCIKCNKETT